MDREIEVTNELAKAEQEFDELIVNLSEEEGEEQEELRVETETEEDVVSEEEKPKKPQKKNDFQKRIDQLTWQAREAERQKDEIARRAALLEERIGQLENEYSSSTQNILEERESTLKAERRKALEDSDFDKFEEIDNELAEVRIKRRVEPTRRTEAKQVPSHQQAQVPLTPDQMFAQEWFAANIEWWETDVEKAQHAMEVDKELKNEGYNSHTPSFWRELDNRLDQFESGRQKSSNTRRESQQIVSGPGTTRRKSKSSFSLSPQEQMYARELGIVQGGPQWNTYINEVKKQREKSNA